ncbi:MAG: hypothetical protein ACR2MQ_05880 [Gemmatimonadaceae bacterium]
MVDMRYDLGGVYIRHVVTHSEYDRLIKRKLLQYDKPIEGEDHGDGNGSGLCEAACASEHS